MRIEFDPSLIENAVFLASREDSDLDRRLHAHTDALYGVENPRERQHAFRRAYEQFFFQLPCSSFIRDILDEHSILEGRIDGCFVREAARRKAQQAELYIHHAGPAVRRTLFIDLTPDSLVHPETVHAWLRRDLLHVVDMLDDKFGYHKESLAGHSPRQNLIRDRYRVLWDIYVAGRLSREGRDDEPFKMRLSGQFEKAFARYSACSYPAEFDRIFQAPLLTHEQLLKWATNPKTLFEPGPDDSEPTSARRGEQCPLCGFSTFDWRGPEQIAPQVLEAIGNDFPDWDPRSGLCTLCAELYTSRCREKSLQELRS